MTLDGKISSKIGDSTWISNDQSRKIVHKLRSQSDAVLIGVNTLLVDNPKLNARYGFSGPKYRVVLDSNYKAPKNSNILAIIMAFFNVNTLAPTDVAKAF